MLIIRKPYTPSKLFEVFLNTMPEDHGAIDIGASP
jgi:hypothetical protein